MPTYKFKCDKCNKGFELNLTLAEYEAKKFTCPKCRSRKLTQQLYLFSASTSKHVVIRKAAKKKKKRAVKGP